MEDNNLNLITDKEYEIMISQVYDPKELITNGNVHLFAQDIVMSNHDTATKLLDELLYWREKAGRI